MLKIYWNGKLTSSLKRNNFTNSNFKISAPKGRGLELDRTVPGKILVVAGGTGLFPFCDLIDLLFKRKLLEEGHPQSSVIRDRNPLL